MKVKSLPLVGCLVITGCVPPTGMPPPEHFEVRNNRTVGVSESAVALFNNESPHVGGATQAWFHRRLNSKHLFGFRNHLYHGQGMLYGGGGVYHRYAIRNDSGGYVGLQTELGFPYAQFAVPLAKRTSFGQIYTIPTLSLHPYTPCLTAPLGLSHWKRERLQLHAETAYRLLYERYEGYVNHAILVSFGVSI